MCSPGAEAAVDVIVEPPAVAHVEYDPRQPPADLPAGAGDGMGVCQNVFEIEASISSSIEVLSPTAVRAYPTDFAIVTRLRQTIYTPQGAPPQLLEHEDGHRLIGAHYYGNAEAAARAAANARYDAITEHGLAAVAKADAVAAALAQDL